MARQTTRGVVGCAKFAFRLFRPGMGWCAHEHRDSGSGSLERTRVSPYQRERVESSHFHSHESFQDRGESAPEGGQLRCFQLFTQRWGKNSFPECIGATVSPLVHGKRCGSAVDPGKKCRLLGRWSQSLGGPRGLHHSPPPLEVAFEKVSPVHSARSRLLCFPGERPVSKVHFTVASLGGVGSGCLKVPPGQSGGLLCQPPL
jgi:hypothetical protein